MTVLSVGLGGAVGALLRMYIDLWLPFQFPLATVSVNIIGSFLLGFITALLLYKKNHEWIKAGIGTGLCGGFTTMSTFAADVFSLYMTQSIIYTAFYLFITLCGSLVFNMYGFHLGVTLRDKRKERLSLWWK